MITDGGVGIGRLRLQYGSSVVRLDETHATVRTESGALVMNGGLCSLILPLLDGTRSADDLVDALADEAPAAEVYYALTLLERRGLIVTSNDDVSEEQAAFWHGLGLDAAAALVNLGRTTVGITPLGDVPHGGLVDALQGNGVQVTEGGDLLAVVTDDYLHDELDEINRASLSAGRPWLLVKPAGTRPWIGPLFVPGRTGCWECLAHRLRANSPAESFIRGRANGAVSIAPPLASLPSGTLAAIGLAATEIARWLACGRSPLEGRLLTLDLRTLEQQWHTLVPRPQCPRCGGGTRVSALHGRPVNLHRRPKAFTADGGHRTCTPDETVRRFSHHVSPITGVVRALAKEPLRGDGGFVNVYSTSPAIALQFRSLSELRWGLRIHGSGKGMSDAQSRASVLCEALERYSGVFQGDEPVRRARLVELGDAAIQPSVCTLFSDAQYQRRHEWNARGNGALLVPEPFDPTAVIDWTPLWSLSQERVKSLPTSFCYFGYRSDSDPVFAWADSNGNAAGNTIEEAILQGFLELVERDAVAIWWYNRLRRPAVDLDSFGEPYLARIQELYRSLHRELWVLDVTSDLGIPAFAAVSRRTDSPAEQILVKFGAHLDARIAVLRAVTEVNQHLPWAHPAPAGPEPQPHDDPDARWWWEHATLATQPYLLPAEGAPRRTAADYPRLWSDDLLDDITFCRQTVGRLGMELLVLDQTRPDIGLPVVKVVVPGLRHYWPRYAPSRLYDVPVRMGWRGRPLAESELNPVPITT